MYRTLKTAFAANRQTFQHLFDIRRMCGTLWNDCVQLARYYDPIHGSWINQSDLQSELKGLCPLHSQTVQAVCRKFLCPGTGFAKRGKRIRPFGIRTRRVSCTPMDIVQFLISRGSTRNSRLKREAIGGGGS